MNWIEVTPETALPKGTEIIALRKRSKFPDKFRDETVAKWDLLEAVRIARVGDICGNDHPDKDRLTWYGKNYTSACHWPHEYYSHYALLSDIELPPIGEPTPEETAKHEEWLARSLASSRRFNEILKANIERAYPELASKAK